MNVGSLPNARVVLDAQIDVLADSESEVARLAEVALAELVLLDLEATLENLLSLGAADGDVDGDPVKIVNLLCPSRGGLYNILLVPPDTEGTDGVAGLAYFPISILRDANRAELRVVL